MSNSQPVDQHLPQSPFRTLTPTCIGKRLVWPRLWPRHKAAFCLPLISLSSPSRHPDNHRHPPHAVYPVGHREPLTHCCTVWSRPATIRASCLSGKRHTYSYFITWLFMQTLKSWLTTWWWQWWCSVVQNEYKAFKKRLRTCFALFYYI